MGSIYEHGNGVPRDYTEALKWYRKAADLNFPLGLYSVGNMYFYGLGVPPDAREAMRWYRRAADLGFADAQNNLGVLYLDGRGVAKDYREALKWLRKAAEQDNALAQRNLADAYAKGLGVKRDQAQADRWYRKVEDHTLKDAGFKAFRRFSALPDQYVMYELIADTVDDVVDWSETFPGIRSGDSAYVWNTCAAKCDGQLYRSESGAVWVGDSKAYENLLSANRSRYTVVSPVRNLFIQMNVLYCQGGAVDADMIICAD